MRLQVQVLPLQGTRSVNNASSLSVAQSHQHPTLPQGALSFLEICEDSISLNELCSKICARFARIYPHKPHLKIKKLQDVYGNDLDLEYSVRDVFDDKSADPQNSVVRVLQEPTTRESSVPPQSALRPHVRGLMGRKRTHGGLSSLREDMMVDGAETGGSEPRSGRSSKRQRIQEVSGDGEEDIDPDLPLPSKEPELGPVGNLTQWTGASQEDPPSQVRGNSQQPYNGESQTQSHSSISHPFTKPNQHVLSDTLTVPESPILQSRHQPTNDQLLQASELANDHPDEATKSESIDDNSGLLHSIPRSSIASPFPEGEGIVAENPLVAPQDRLPTPIAQAFQGKEPGGGLQSIITPSNTPDTSGHQVAQSLNKLKRPNPSMFKPSNRQTSSPDRVSSIYDAIETDRDDTPCLPPLRPPPEKRPKRHSSFTSIVNGQSPIPNVSSRGNSRHRSGSEGVAAKLHSNNKSNYPLEVKWLRAHSGPHDQSAGQEDKRNPEDTSDSSFIPKRGSKITVREGAARGRPRREVKAKTTRGARIKATVEAEQQQSGKEAEDHTVFTPEQIKRLKTTAQAAEEMQRQKEAMAKEKLLEKEQQNQERKERAQKQAQEKAMKAEKAEKEAEARRLAKMKEEKATSEATEKISLRKKPRRTQKAEQASSDNKRKRPEQAPSEPSGPSAEVTSSSKPREGRRMSTTPLMPRAVVPKGVRQNGQDANSKQKASTGDASLDPQIPTSIEQGTPRRRSVSFLVDESPQPASNPPAPSPIPVDPAPLPAPTVVPRKVTMVYPPGMGPDNLKSLMENSAENSITLITKIKGKPMASSKKGVTAKTQANPNSKGGAKKATDGKLVPNPVPNPVQKPTPTKETAISSESGSVSSYHPDADSGSETIAVDTPAPRNPTLKTDKENESSDPRAVPYTLRSQSLSRNPPTPAPQISSPPRSPVRYISRTPSGSDSDPDSASRSTTSESASSSGSKSSPSKPSRSRSGSIEESSSDDESSGDSESTSSQASSQPLQQSDKGISDGRDEVLSDLSFDGKEAVNRLDNSTQGSTQRPTGTPTNRGSIIQSSGTGNSSQAKPSLNSFPSLSQLGSQKFGHGSQDRNNVAGSQKPQVGAQGGINSTPMVSKEDEESSSSDDDSSDDDRSGNDKDNKVPKNRQARNNDESNKVSRGLKGLLSGMFLW